ncbi:16S rRNA (guanine(527)-N(7))-methyltransferase RsmG [Bifidobacterium polysaccharolyticum]|uniref:16S rRNA (guanine(527)-N(7))-methyltransferase RsmG n=1 Tax=Bifidobacterium polysaccharolyticum TaxID=2750967 RepID=UPI0018DC42A3|nr:16S rRNA (guanine(527)-N(7))-methyltransferase RsmG [Bifidobacterium polysaccharolyticum]MBI0064418.1 16S rRNA (guanine(527)-N(7))-methyltransferase RsmG [Bifidobacterium polysaccharolyticum]
MAVVDDELNDSPLLRQVLGDALVPMQRFHEKLLREGVERGIIGPRDEDIIWERHILNSAAIVPFVRERLSTDSQTATVVDIGSGGGFPGIVLAACLPQCNVVLVEPMERRVTWLQEVVDELHLANAVVIRKRAEDLVPQSSKASIRHNKKGTQSRRHGRRRIQKQSVSAYVRGGSLTSTEARNADSQQDVNDHDSSKVTGGVGLADVQSNLSIPQTFDVVTCRAVAPMTKLAGWTLPLLRSRGQLIALKGRSAQAELDKAAKEIKKCHGENPRVCLAPVAPGLEDTHVVLVDKH